MKAAKSKCIEVSVLMCLWVLTADESQISEGRKQGYKEARMQGCKDGRKQGWMETRMKQARKEASKDSLHAE